MYVGSHVNFLYVLLCCLCCLNLFWLKYMKKMQPHSDMYLEKGGTQEAFFIQWGIFFFHTVPKLDKQKCLSNSWNVESEYIVLFPMLFCIQIQEAILHLVCVMCPHLFCSIRHRSLWKQWLLCYDDFSHIKVSLYNIKYHILISSPILQKHTEYLSNVSLTVAGTSSQNF